MGFFSDLKEDLSQAVNELNEQIRADGEETGKEQPAAEEQQEQTTAGQETGADISTLSLEEMLENIDAISLPDELIQEPEEPGAPAFPAFDEAQETAETHPEEEAFVGETETAETRPEEEAFGGDKETAETRPEEEAFGGNKETAETRPEEETLWEPETVSPPAAEENESHRQEPEAKTSEIEESKGAENNMENNTERIAVDETSVITEGMMITGDIITEGSIDLIGTVTGNIDALGKLNVTGHINGNSKAAEIYAEGAKINGEIVSEGAVKIGASSVVIGNITATSAAIAGAVKGDIDVKGPVILDASAIVMGNIKSKSVQINNGAVIEGMCSQCYADVNPTSFFDEYKPEVRKTKNK